MSELIKDILPEGVIDSKQYKIYLALQKHPAIRNTAYTTSEGDEINLGVLPHHLRKRIEHLSLKEQESIMELKRQYNVIRMKINNAKAMAYGRMGRYGGKKKEEMARYKLTPFEEDIIELLGRMFTIAEVVKIMGEDYKIIASDDDVKEILKKHIIEIERKREEFRNRLADVRLYNKRPRLEELAWMYSKMKAKYVSLNGAESYNSMLRTLEQIRKESEGDILSITGALDVNIEVKIQNHIQKDILKTINLKEIILGRVAARMNFDTKKLIAGLHNSYYAKFVDISGDFDPDAEMMYPSLSAYDFSAIERNAEGATLDVTAEEVTEVEKSSAERTKELFLSKIRKQRQEMESRNSILNTIAEDRKSNPIEDEPIKRKKGSGKDRIPPSKLKSNAARMSKKDYYTGNKKTE